jgi:hypothetical protein
MVKALVFYQLVKLFGINAVIQYLKMLYVVVALRRELEEMLQAQMKMSSALKDENKRLILKLEGKKESHR